MIRWGHRHPTEDVTHLQVHSGQLGEPGLKPRLQLPTGPVLYRHHLPPPLGSPDPQPVLSSVGAEPTESQPQTCPESPRPRLHGQGSNTAWKGRVTVLHHADTAVGALLASPRGPASCHGWILLQEAHSPEATEGSGKKPGCPPAPLQAPA